MSTKYLDYEHLEYYHQKLKLDFDALALTKNDTENIFNEVIQSKNKKFINKSMVIPETGYLRIRLGARYTGSGYAAAIPIEWKINNLTLQSNTDYTYYKIIDAQNYFIANGEYQYNIAAVSQLYGLSIELVFQDENNDMHYYSTIGKMPADVSTKFLDSQYKIWDGMTLLRSQYLNNSCWNFIEMDLPVGAAETYCLNYYTESSNFEYDDDYDNDPFYTMVIDRFDGNLFASESNEFKVTLIHNTFNEYSVIFHWMCAEILD